MAVGLEILASNIQAALMNIAPIISVILIVLGGVIYGISFTQPAENRGKMQTMGVSMFIGGVIVGAIVGAATIIAEMSSGLLK